MPADCLFCQIAAVPQRAVRVFEDDVSIAFLDHRPLFPGHTLLIPRQHYETLEDLPQALLPAFFGNAQRIGSAIEAGMRADGLFLAINNRISQSVPHLHVHLVPRRRGDGLRGFFWPRQKYASDAEIEQVADAIRAQLTAARADQH